MIQFKLSLGFPHSGVCIERENMNVMFPEAHTELIMVTIRLTSV